MRYTVLTADFLPCRSHNGVITGVVFSPSGHALYSSSSTGSLAMYDLSDISAAKVSAGCDYVVLLNFALKTGQFYSL